MKIILLKKNIILTPIWKVFTFINQLAEKAEKNNHHPDLVVGWCKIRSWFLPLMILVA